MKIDSNTNLVNGDYFENGTEQQYKTLLKFIPKHDHYKLNSKRLMSSGILFKNNKFLYRVTTMDIWKGKNCYSFIEFHSLVLRKYGDMWSSGLNLKI